MRLAIVGHGRMGKAVEELARERGHTVGLVVTGAGNREGEALTPERLAGIDVALEFTRPDTVLGNLERLIRAGIPTVTGTTGWFDRLPELDRLVRDRGGSLLYAPNFSVGVQLFLRAAADLTRRFAGRPGFEGTILEQHHAGKRDAPSGTALRLREGVRRVDPDREFPITSVRSGTIPGTHALLFDAPAEVIRIEHVARGREAFAAGALSAAEWLPGHQGLFSFEEMLFGRES
jgi:4-hydroxy-tetrahydrodipicolinate reductase